MKMATGGTFHGLSAHAATTLFELVSSCARTDDGWTNVTALHPSIHPLWRFGATSSGGWRSFDSFDSIVITATNRTNQQQTTESQTTDNIKTTTKFFQRGRSDAALSSLVLDTARAEVIHYSNASKIPNSAMRLLTHNYLQSNVKG
jgi:hypothetical protein